MLYLSCFEILLSLDHNPAHDRHGGPRPESKKTIRWPVPALPKLLLKAVQPSHWSGEKCSKFHYWRRPVGKEYDHSIQILEYNLGGRQ